MPAKLDRDRFFWTIALQTVAVNFFLGGFGPALPLLRADQGTSLTIAGLHGTSMGIAAIAAGLSNPWLTHRFGRANAGWIGLWIFSFGLIAISFLQPVQFTILAAFFTGFGTSTVINSFVTSLNSHYGARAPLAVAQANGIASIGYVLGTLTIGTIAQTAPHFWRISLLAALPLAFYLYFFRRDKTIEAHVPTEDGPQSGKLSKPFWITWFGFIATISSEFAIAFWAAALVRDRTDATAAISTIAIFALGTGMGLGRFYGGMVLHRLSLDRQLLLILVAQMLGFFGLWFSHNLAISLAMLLLIGLGISMQFALTSLRLISHSDGRPDLAIGKSSFAAGIAIGGAPFLLGVLGDLYGISRAYLMVPVLIMLAITAVLVAPAKMDQEILDDLQI
jgi:predicted MFS family arabinose efflux permease